jgi:hypothetical protein
MLRGGGALRRGRVSDVSKKSREEYNVTHSVTDTTTHVLRSREID